MLGEFQHAFGRSLLADFQAPPPAGLVAGDPARAAQRFMIHRGNVVESLVGALGHGFPAVRAVCGAHNFRILAAGYVRARPPERPALLSYGDGFAAYIDEHPRARGDFPHLPELARLEWALNEAYYAEDAPALAATDLAAVPPEQLGTLALRLHPSARLVASVTHPIHTLWMAASAAEEADEPFRFAGDLPESGEAVLVLRSSGPVEAFALDPGESVFLAAIAAEACLEEALTAGAEAAPGFDPAAALAAALTRGAFGAEISFLPTPSGGEI